MGGKKWGRNWKTSASVASENTTKSVCSDSSKRRGTKKTSRSNHLEYLALPNIHVVSGVLKDHFKTLDRTHVQRLEHLIDQIKTKHDECFPKPPKIEDKKVKKNKEDDVTEIFSNLSMIKSDEETWSTLTPYKQLKIENLNQDVENKLISTKCNESQTSNHKISYKSVNTSCINLVDVATSFPESKNSEASIKWIKRKSSANSSEPTTMLIAHQEPIMIPSVQFIESVGDSFYSCSTELSNFSNKLIMIKICLSDASNDIALDCKLTNKKIEKSLPFNPRDRLNGIYRLFESYKQTFFELLTATNFSWNFKCVYLCVWGIVQVFWSLCSPTFSHLNRLKQQKKKVKEKGREESDGFSEPKLRKCYLERNYSRKREEIVEMFRVSNVCSILS